MHTIRLDISNDVFDKVMFILENLPKNKVSIEVKENTSSELTVNDNSFSKFIGILDNEFESNDTKYNEIIK